MKQACNQVTPTKGRECGYGIGVLSEMEQIRSYVIHAITHGQTSILIFLNLHPSILVVDQWWERYSIDRLSSEPLELENTYLY